MRDYQARHGHDSFDLINVPAVRYERCFAKYDHAGGHDDTEAEAEPKATERPWHFDEEVGELKSLERMMSANCAGESILCTHLCSGTPCHINLKHVSQKSLRDVDRDAAEEDEEEEKPFELLAERAKKRSLAGAVAESSSRDIIDWRTLVRTPLDKRCRTELTAVEHKHKNDPDVPRADVVFVDIALEPADDAVVGSGQDPGSSNGIVGADVCDDVDLGTESHIAADELAEQGRKRPADEPEAEWVENQLVAAVGVLLPASELVIDLEVLALVPYSTE